jgi:hypothetical protein
VRFLFSGFIHQSTPFGLLFTLLNFFRILFRIRPEFDICAALWATAENQIFFADAIDLKLGWCRPSLVLFIYTHFLSFTVPLKDMASF